MNPTPDTIRVAVIGAGHVGATFASALLLSGVANDIVLVDTDTARAEGEAMDIDHAIPQGRPARVRAGGPDACAGADVVVDPRHAPALRLSACPRDRVRHRARHRPAPL